MNDLTSPASAPCDLNLSHGDQRTGLSAFSRALARQAHVLSREPNLVWQQLYNELQWDYTFVFGTLLPELERRINPGSVPWLRLRVRIPESDGVVRTLSDHIGAVKTCAISPDGTFIVSGGSDSHVRIWDSRTGELRATLRGHTGGIRYCAITPDGSLVVSASEDKSLRVWDTATGRERATLRGLENWPCGCAISPDGSFVASFDIWTLWIWDLATGSERARVPLPIPDLRKAGFIRAIVSLAGGWLRDGFVALPYGLAISPDGSSVYIGLGCCSLAMWQVASGKMIGVRDWGPHVFHRCPTHLAIDPTGDSLISVTDRGRLRRHDLAKRPGGPMLTEFKGQVSLGVGPMLAEFKGQASSRITALAISPDGAFALLASSEGGRAMDSSLRIWDFARGRERTTFFGHSSYVNDCAVSPDGTFVVSASEDATLKIWHLDDERRNRAPDGTQRRASRRVLDILGRQSGRAAGGKTSEFFGAVVPTVAIPVAHNGGVSNCAMSPDGTFLLSTGDGRPDSTMKVWDLRTMSTRVAIESRRFAAATGCAISRDGSLVVSAHKEALIVSSTVTGRLEARFKGLALSISTVLLDFLWWNLFSETAHGEVYRCSISPDGAFVAAAGWVPSAGIVKSRIYGLGIWDTTTFKRKAFFPEVGGEIEDCAVHPNGKSVVATSSSGALKIWDVATGSVRVSVQHPGKAAACAVSPDGLFVVSAGDLSLELWDAESGQHRVSLLGQREITGCGISADGLFVVSVGLDRTLRIWTASTGKEIARLELPAPLRCVALHPYLPLAVCGDVRGHLYLADIVGVDCGPIIVTPVTKQSGATLQCPVCRHMVPLHPNWLGQVVRCVRASCLGRMRVNPFQITIGPPIKQRILSWGLRRSG